MTRVLAVVGPETETLEGAERAIAFAQEHGAELHLLGVAERPRRLLRSRSVAEREAVARAHLREAAAKALAAGVRPRVAALRRGRVIAELARFADVSGADIVFVTRMRPRWWARILGRPRAELQEVTLSRRARTGGGVGTAAASRRAPTRTPAPARALQ